MSPLMTGSAPDPSLARAYTLILLLLEERADEADLFDQLLNEADHQALAQKSLSLAAAVLDEAWGALAPNRIRRLLLAEMEKIS